MTQQCLPSIDEKTHLSQQGSLSTAEAKQQLDLSSLSSSPICSSWTSMLTTQSGTVHSATHHQRSSTPLHDITHHRRRITTTRRLSISITAYAVLYHILLIYVANYIPNDTIATAVTAYSSVAASLSFVGFLGSLLRRPKLISIFALFHFLDAIIASVCRLLVLQFVIDAIFADEQGIFCSECSRRHGLEAGYDVVAGAGWQRDHAWWLSAQNADQRTAGWSGCRWALSAAELIAMGIVLAMALTQATLAIRVRRFGKEIERRKAGSLKNTQILRTCLEKGNH